MNVRHTIVEDIHVAQLKWYGHVQRRRRKREKLERGHHYTSLRKRIGRRPVDEQGL